MGKYKFTIEYYCEKLPTGDLNYHKTRTAVIFAKDRQEAITKLSLADDNYINVKDYSFEEIEKGGEQE